MGYASLILDRKRTSSARAKEILLIVFSFIHREQAVIPATSITCFPFRSASALNFAAPPGERTYVTTMSLRSSIQRFLVPARAMNIFHVKLLHKK